MEFREQRLPDAESPVAIDLDSALALATDIFEIFSIEPIAICDYSQGSNPS